MSHIERGPAATQLCCDTRGMGINTRDGAVLWFFTAWFALAVLAFSGAAVYAALLCGPLLAVTAYALLRWSRGRSSRT